MNSDQELEVGALHAEVRALLERSRQLRDMAADNMRLSQEALAEAQRLLDQAHERARAAEKHLEDKRAH